MIPFAVDEDAALAELEAGPGPMAATTPFSAGGRHLVRRSAVPGDVLAGATPDAAEAGPIRARTGAAMQVTDGAALDDPPLALRARRT